MEAPTFAYVRTRKGVKDMNRRNFMASLGLGGAAVVLGGAGVGVAAKPDVLVPCGAGNTATAMAQFHAASVRQFRDNIERAINLGRRRDPFAEARRRRLDAEARAMERFHRDTCSEVASWDDWEYVGGVAMGENGKPLLYSNIDGEFLRRRKDK